MTIEQHNGIEAVAVGPNKPVATIEILEINGGWKTSNKPKAMHVPNIIPIPVKDFGNGDNIREDLHREQSSSEESDSSGKPARVFENGVASKFEEDFDEAQTTCFVPREVFNRIRQALDKARFCLSKINCITSKRLQELSQEESEHIKVINQLTVESLVEEDPTVVEELSVVSEALFRNMEHLGLDVLDTQNRSLVDIIATLKQDVKTELLTLKGMKDLNQQSSVEVVKISKDARMTFLRNSSWTMFGFSSLVAANLGCFWHPWLLQSFYSCFGHFSYIRNSTIFTNLFK